MFERMNVQNVNRIRAKEIITLLPGIHLRRLQELLGTSFSTTRYHVNNLLKAGEIVATSDGRYSRLYPLGVAEEMKPVYACLQSRTARVVLRGIAESPSAELTQTDLAERIDLPRSTINEYVTMLNQVQLVRRTFTIDGRVLYGLQDREKVENLLAAFSAKGLLSAATDSFIDLWDI